MHLVCHIIASLENGGAQATLARLCSGSTAFKHTVLSFMDGGHHLEPLRKSGVPVTTLGLQRGRVGLRQLVRLYSALKAIRPDVIQTWMYHADLVGGLAARAAGVRSVVWNVRHSELGCGSKLSTRLTMRASALLSMHVPATIVTCATRAQEVHVTCGYDLQRFVVIPNGFDFDEFNIDDGARLRFRLEIGAGEATPVVGAIGRWTPQKDHATLLAALARARHLVPNMLCVVVGAGCEKDNPNLTRLLARYGLGSAVRLLGARADVPSVMNGLDLLVLSASHGEGFPNVVAEAMACGTPCVVTDVGDAAAIVGEAGWVVPPRDPVALGDAIRCALAWLTDGESSRQRPAIRNAVRRFSLQRTVEAYEAVWLGALGAPGSHHAR